MPKVGDRVVVEGSKVGGGRREGTLQKMVGSLIQVRWTDGSETLFSPGAGSVQFFPGNGKTVKASPASSTSGKASKASAKPAGKPAGKAAGKAAAKPAAKGGKGGKKK